MTLHISQLQYQRIQEVLEAAYPQEGCGVLVGKRVFEAVEGASSPPASPQEAYRQVVQVISVANAWEPGLLGEGDGEGAGDGGNPSDGGDPNDRENPSNGEAESNNGDPADGPSSHGAHDRYWIDPADLLRIQKQARDQGLEILGIVHSHPDHPAIPSECDRRLAWPVYSYLIASVCGGQVIDLQSWRLNDAQRFEPEPICPNLASTP